MAPLIPKLHILRFLDSDEKDLLQKNEKPHLWLGNFFPSCHNTPDYYIRVFLKDLFPILCPVAAARFINPGEPDRIVRPKFLNQYFKSFLLDLV